MKWNEKMDCFKKIVNLLKKRPISYLFVEIFRSETAREADVFLVV